MENLNMRQFSLVPLKSILGHYESFVYKGRDERLLQLLQDFEVNDIEGDMVEHQFYSTQVYLDPNKRHFYHQELDAKLPYVQQNQNTLVKSDLTEAIKRAYRYMGSFENWKRGLRLLSNQWIDE